MYHQNNLITVRGKVIFSQASVILSTQRGGMNGSGGVWQRGVHGRRACVARGVHGRGHVWQGTSMVGGGIHGSGCAWWGCAWQRGACVAGGGACEAGEMATAVDGTHPTGMHSCSYLLMFLPLIAVRYFPDSVNSKSYLKLSILVHFERIVSFSLSCFLEITLSIKCFFTPMALMFS